MKNKGFTLIELLVVGAIIAIFVTIGVETYVKYQSAQEQVEEIRNEGARDAANQIINERYN